MGTNVEKLTSSNIAPWVRVLILILSVITICFLSWYFTGSIIPTSGDGSTLIFQNALLLIVLGSAILEFKFTKPADSVVNSLMGIITLLTIYKQPSILAWWSMFSYCATVFVLSGVCTAVSTGKDVTGWRESVARVTYRPAVLLGGARRLFSILFLFGIFSFYELQSRETVALLLFWGLFVVIWPLGLPELLSSFHTRKASLSSIGRVVRTDWPNVVRVALSPDSTWSRKSLKIYQQADGKQRLVLPLYSQVQEDQLLGTGMCIGDVAKDVSGLGAGLVLK